MKKALLFIVLSLTSTNIFSASSDTRKVHGDIISIDGNYARRTMTQAERLKALRSKLERQTERAVRKKIEELRFMQEVELSKKIQQAFNQKMNALDEAFADDTNSNL